LGPVCQPIPSCDVVIHPRRTTVNLRFEGNGIRRQRAAAVRPGSPPPRLDLDEVPVKAACEQAMPLSLATDAQSADQFSFLDGAVRQTRRRGWAQKQHVLNARPLAALRRQLRAARAEFVMRTFSYFVRGAFGASSAEILDMNTRMDHGRQIL
jgi:hypothetical protein